MGPLRVLLVFLAGISTIVEFFTFSSDMLDENYVQTLLEEKSILDPYEFSHTVRLLEDEINRVQRCDDVPNTDIFPVQSTFREEVVKLSEKIFVPVREYPSFNFVGKLLGPKGNTLKRLQANTHTKISILGRGSTRDRDKEEEMSESGDPRYEHLKEPLHVYIEAEAIKSEAYQRLGRAIAEVYECLQPENEELRMQQMREMEMLSTQSRKRGHSLR